MRQRKTHARRSPPQSTKAVNFAMSGWHRLGDIASSLCKKNTGREVDAYDFPIRDSVFVNLIHGHLIQDQVSVTKEMLILIYF